MLTYATLRGMETNRQTEPSTHTELGAKLGMKVIEAHEEKTVITMPVDGNTQVAGVLHGGATAALCETAGSTAAFIHAHKLAGDADPESGWNKVAVGSARRLTAVGTELSVAHVRSARGGVVTATATAVHLGRRTTVHTVVVSDETGNTVATAIASNMIIEV